MPKKIDEENGIEVEAEGYKVSITPMDMKSSFSKKTNEKKNVKSSSEKSLKKYRLEDYVSDSVLDGKVEYTQDESSKIEYIFSGSGLKENIVLSEVPEDNQTYSFKIKADGLTAKLKKDNTVKLLDKDKKAVFVIPAPYMYDSDFAFSDEVETTLKKEGKEYILTYAPDHEWLADKERAYPVTVDPTVSTKPYNDKVVDTSVLSTAALDLASNPYLYAGALGNRNCVVDAYIKFAKLPRIEKQWTISNAKLNLKTASDKSNKINAYKIKSEWETSTVRENPPSVESTIVDVCSVPSKTDTWVYWDITNTVYDWYNGEANYGIKLSSPYAQNNQSVFYSADAADSENIPYISVEYKTISSAQLENSRSVDIGRAGTATINDFTGNLVLSREDIGVDGNVMPVNISMIYNLNQVNSVTFGYGFTTNYTQTINYTGDVGRNKYYEYMCGDGSKVYFDYDEETGEYTDRSDRGYTIENSGTKTNDYLNITITDSSGYEYQFDKYGRLIKISSNKGTEESAIEIAYVGDYTKYYEIDYIKDGVGRKYDFNYTDGKLTDISYYGNTNTVLKKVTYQYDSGSKLTKVTYPDGESVKYYYGNQCLVSAYNTDDYHVTFNYTNYTSSSKANRVTGIKEYGSQGTKGGDISVIYTPFQTEYINNNTGDTETLVFSNDGDLISTYNSDGYVTVNEYAKSSEAHGVSSLVNTYEHKKSETNLIANGEFESDVSGWQTVNGVNHPWDSQGHPGNSGSVKLVGHPNGTSVILQRIEVSGTKGDTYDIGGWVKANASSGNVLISLDGFDKKVLGMNLFSYANNNPISNRDSLGFVAVVDDLTLACIACVLAIAGVASYTVTSSGNVSWSGGVISNSRQLDIASSTTVTVRTKTKSISDSLIRTQRITREKVNKADYLLATEVIYGSDRRGCNRNFIPIYPITRSAAIKALKKKKSIFTKFEHMAKGVAQNAGNGKTIHHTAKKAGYFSHHHPAKTVKMKNGKNKSVKKDGHAFYLGK